MPQILVIRNDLAELARVGLWVNAWSQDQKLPAAVAERLDLCSVEAVTNIVTHAYVDDASHEIRLRLECQGDLVSLEIEDDGRVFDPRQVEEPWSAASLEDARIGGLGVPIVRNFSDDLQHRRHDGCNHLTLYFRLPQTELGKEKTNE